MKFGKLPHSENINFKLQADQFVAEKIFSGYQLQKANMYVGCTIWGRAELKHFYPRGIKDELSYYGSQFDCIELNATFYNNFPSQTIESWCEKTPDTFRFFPKVHQSITHWKLLKNAQAPTEIFLDSVAHFQDKLGMLFMQLPESFGPVHWETLSDYLNSWPSGFPLALELRHPDWYNGKWDNKKLFHLMESKNITHIITDAPGRRDLVHMRLTTPTAFIRFNGSTESQDRVRLDDWYKRLALWTSLGLENIYFFMHQNEEQSAPLMASYLIQKLNVGLNAHIKMPRLPPQKQQLNLFD
jgi:uncharacterized protein YecE (DUF72 family)